MGADINAKLGVRDGENYKDILGPNGFNDRNSKGELLLDIYGSHNLRVAHTYCTHDKYTTYVSLDPSKTPSTHDIFAISKELQTTLKLYQMERRAITRQWQQNIIEVNQMGNEGKQIRIDRAY